MHSASMHAFAGMYWCFWDAVWWSLQTHTATLRSIFAPMLTISLLWLKIKAAKAHLCTALQQMLNVYSSGAQQEAGPQEPEALCPGRVWQDVGRAGHASWRSGIHKSGSCFPGGGQMSSLLPQEVKWKQNMISTKIITKETQINEKPYEMKLWNLKTSR